MFGLISNNFTLPDTDIEDYVQWDVTLNHYAFQEGKEGYYKHTTSLGLHLCTEADENEFFEP